MKVFASTNVYALAKRLGMKGALAEFERQMLHPGLDSLPCVRTLYRIQQLADVHVYVDCGIAAIGKSRCRSFHEALESDAQAWVTVDDDIEATSATIGALLEVLADDLTPRLVTVPYVLRNPNDVQTSVRLPVVRIERKIAGYRVVDLPHPASSGFGLVGINRRALETIADSMRETPGYFLDNDNRRKLAAFHELIDGEMWYGEDNSFFRRIPPDVEVHALLTGTISHDGTPLKLDNL